MSTVWIAVLAWVFLMVPFVAALIEVKPAEILVYSGDAGALRALRAGLAEVVEPQSSVPGWSSPKAAIFVAHADPIGDDVLREVLQPGYEVLLRVDNEVLIEAPGCGRLRLAVR